MSIETITRGTGAIPIILITITKTDTESPAASTDDLERAGTAAGMEAADTAGRGDLKGCTAAGGSAWSGERSASCC